MEIIHLFQLRAAPHCSREPTGAEVVRQLRRNTNRGPPSSGTLLKPRNGARRDDNEKASKFRRPFRTIPS